SQRASAARRCWPPSSRSGSTTSRRCSSRWACRWRRTSCSPASSAVPPGASGSWPTGGRGSRGEGHEAPRGLGPLHTRPRSRFPPGRPRRPGPSVPAQGRRAARGHGFGARRRVRHRGYVRADPRAAAPPRLSRHRRDRTVRRGGARAIPGGGRAVPRRLALRPGSVARRIRRRPVPAHPRAPARLRARGAADVRARPAQAHHRLLLAAPAAPAPAQARRAVRAGLLPPHVRPGPLRRSPADGARPAARAGPHPSWSGNERPGFRVGRAGERHLRAVPVRASLIISTFNHARFLGAAIDSALAQTLGVVDVIVVDDGSTDDTPAVLERYAGRIRVLRQPNRGLAAARNTGLAAARGTFVSFLDADDVMAPTK